MTETRKVVRREPIYIEVDVVPGHGGYGVRLETGARFTYNAAQLENEFIDADLAADIAWNQFVVRMAEQWHIDSPIDPEMQSGFVYWKVRTWIENQIKPKRRPIATTEGTVK